MLARHRLVEAEESTDARERPWRATITGFELHTAAVDADAPEARGAAALMAASLQLDQPLTREYLTHRDRVSATWRESDAYSTYALRVTPTELHELIERVDGLIRPLIAATREHPPDSAELVHLGLYAFPRSWQQ